MPLSPKVYVACLASYNAGVLHGVWIDAAQDAGDIEEEVKAMLAKSRKPGAEEFAIHDTEDLGDNLISQFSSLEEVSAIGLAVEEHGEAFFHFAADVGVDYAIEKFEEAYLGEWDSEVVYAQQYYEDIWEIPAHLEFYIDWDAVARDLFLESVVMWDGHVFDRNV